MCLHPLDAIEIRPAWAFQRASSAAGPVATSIRLLVDTSGEIESCAVNVEHLEQSPGRSRLGCTLPQGSTYPGQRPK